MIIFMFIDGRTNIERPKLLFSEVTFSTNKTVINWSKCYICRLVDWKKWASIVPCQDS